MRQEQVSQLQDIVLTVAPGRLWESQDRTVGNNGKYSRVQTGGPSLLLSLAIRPHAPGWTRKPIN